MGGPPGSQAAPLPNDLPFRLVSKTIGSGAYATIKKAAPLNKPEPVIAVKFINKEHAFRVGHLRPKQLELEISLHARCCRHPNVIRYISHGADPAWVWVAMELADGGDLFDKIEADEGVGQDVAHFYFRQLVAAVGWCHSQGVAHRDIKPENMLLSAGGDLKLADFGLATQYLEPKTGKRKACAMVCGSPPYIAPEILMVGNRNGKRKSGEDRVGYDPQGTDVWSCAIVLFVLLVGNTPWDSPVREESYEFNEFIKANGRPTDELWDKVPNEALSLLRGMLKTDPAERFSLDEVSKHLWFTRPNPHLNSHGKVADPIVLATKMLESLHVNFDADPTATAKRPSRADGDMDVDDDGSLHPAWTRLASTQPETPIADVPFDWERPPRLGGGGNVGGGSSSQPVLNDHVGLASHNMLSQSLMDDPLMSQFSQVPAVSLTLTQAARQFNDIVPSYSLARFISFYGLPQLLPVLLAALHRLNIPVLPPSQNAMDGHEERVIIRFKTLDGRQQPLHGNLVVERITLATTGGEVASEVRFLKAKGDPLEWRRLFKRIAVLCKDCIVKGC